MTTITNINIRVYYKVALYPEDTFDSDNWEDYYDFVKDREDKFNLHLITNDKASFVTKKFIEYCNWNKEDDEYVNKISYYGNGLFIAELYFSYLHLDDIRDMYYETEIKEIILSQLFPDTNSNINSNYIHINDIYYEIDTEIESVYIINSNGKELELLFTNNEQEELEIEEELKEEELKEEELKEEEEQLIKREIEEGEEETEKREIEKREIEKKENKRYKEKVLLKKQISIYKKRDSNIIHAEMELEDYED